MNLPTGRAYFGQLSPMVQGIVLAVLGGIMFQILNATLRQLTTELDTFVTAWFRWLFGLLFIAPWLLRFGWEPFRTARLPLHLLRSTFHTGGYMIWYAALPLIPLVDMTALSFTQPLFVTLGAALLLGERLRLRRVAALAVGFAGILVIVRPGFAEVTLGTLMMLATQPLAAAQNLIAKSLTRTDRAITIVAWQNVLAVILFLPTALWFWQTPDWRQLGLFAFAGIVGTSGYFLIVQAYRVTEISALQPFSFLSIVWSAMLGYWLFMQTPDLWVLTGAGVVIAATSYIAHRETQAVRGGAAT